MSAKKLYPKVFKTRLERVQNRLKSRRVPAALILSSAAPTHLSRDVSREYRQLSDFYYLTGCRDENLILFISSAEKRAIIFAPPDDPRKKLWEGGGSNLQEIARNLNADLIVHENRKQEVTRRLKGVAILYYQNEVNTLAWELARSLIETPSHHRGNLPAQFAHADTILEPMRLFKDAAEVQNIVAAGSITNAALVSVIDFVKEGVTESQLAASIDCFFRMQHSTPAFPTIVASGPSAATLHHTPGQKELRQGELVLIDLGAEHQLYAADITRTLPVSGKFSEAQKELYQAVLEAQKAAISKVRDGVLIHSVYSAAVAVLVDYLRDIKILKGTKSSLLEDKKYLSYFPHSIGHSLGLDVHDVGNLRGNNEARLKSGMVFTVEPGLYFSKKQKGLPSCGVRIEDDVLVTKKGCEVLSAGFPKEIDEIEALF